MFSFRYASGDNEFSGGNGLKIILSIFFESRSRLLIKSVMVSSDKVPLIQ